ncbi:MAG: CDP-glycerol glycerophosphotransferase family protein, partial [Clostridia bacterium]|nr:CDP-glycerol glycerophosphotransferase family protein [Clostridia bacterium]
ECEMKDRLEVFISDNGKTLKIDDLQTEKIHIFPNKNLGGAGGFTRSMIEIMKAREQKGITHIMMMDDDVRLNPDSILRTYRMLRLLKDEERDAFIGGHMLKIDSQHIQSEAADHWDIAKHHPVKYNYNLEKPEMLVKNEIEDSVNHFGWWYCCMPINVPSENNLPLPIFIKRDDIEYGLRNGTKFITLNGICVWHEPFEYKYATYLEYYYFRNMCIINSRHRLSFTAERLIEEVKVRIKDFLLRYRYRDAELSLIGIQHYLNGIDWFKSLDGEGLNAEIMKLGYKKVPVDQIDGFVFTHGVYEANLRKPQPNEKEMKKRRWSLNGWLKKPIFDNVVVPAYQPASHLFYRAKRVINYEEASNTAFVTEKSFSSLFYIIKLYRKTVKLIKKKYKKVTAEYRDRYDELTNIKFWNSYLFENGVVPKISSPLDKVKRPKSTKEQKKVLNASRWLRFIQGCLFWLPMKKNRIMFYVHDRKGFTCNPRYIAEELVRQYGDRAEIIWATSHPDTCDDIKALGINVIHSGSSKQFFKYLRTRFFITNDSFPVWALHKPNQLWMNTWHAGMNYKHIGYDYLMPMSKVYSKTFRIKNRQPNFYLSGSKFFTEDTSVSFRYNKKVFVPTGLPRNDIFFQDRPDIVEKVRKFYGIEDGVKTVLFAPTFRVGMKSSTFGMDFKKICDALSRRFGGKWVLLFRNHNFVKAKNKYPGAIDVSGYHDMQELMYMTDVLISDYSSCLYDFCFTGKPAFVYATDIENYMKNERSFAYPIEKWPFPITDSNESLVDRIESFDEADYKSRVEEHLKDGGAYDNGTASKQAVDIIKKYCF